MKKRQPYRAGVRSDSRVSWQIIQSVWIFCIFLLLLLGCNLLADLARTNRAMLHLSQPSGTPLESLPASTPCHAIEITAPENHIQETQWKCPRKAIASKEII